MNKVIIIAEAGVNHNGSIELAKKLVDVAAEAGADYIKFQTFKAEKLVSAQARKADYQIENTGDGSESQFDMLKKLELTEEAHQQLIDYCKIRGIRFFSTAFDEESLAYLASLGWDLVKIPSGEITNLPYLRKAARLFKHVIISTGMATMQEVKEAVAVFAKEGINKEQITVLHCNTEYPTPMKDVNLQAMKTISEETGLAIGYSDHTLGIEISIAAVALGARVIEKHITLDRTMTGPDHNASLEPDELKAMVKSIRNIEMAMGGTGVKEPSESEQKNIAIARKSIHIAKAVPAGHALSEHDLIMKRPGNGISPMRFEEILGRTVKADLPADHLLTFDDLN